MENDKKEREEEEGVKCDTRTQVIDGGKKGVY